MPHFAGIVLNAWAKSDWVVDVVLFWLRTKRTQVLPARLVSHRRCVTNSPNHQDVANFQPRICNQSILVALLQEVRLQLEAQVD